MDAVVGELVIVPIFLGRARGFGMKSHEEEEIARAIKFRAGSALRCRGRVGRDVPLKIQFVMRVRWH